MIIRGKAANVVARMIYNLAKSSPETMEMNRSGFDGEEKWSSFTFEGKHHVLVRYEDSNYVGNVISVEM